MAFRWLRWFPWKFVVRRVARAHGFLDPITLLGTLHRFAQPSEVAEPLELLRAGVVFHARGLLNARVVQHNLDWVWPYWIERQFDPLDRSFIPRAFSITHVNLTHRNWTAIGLPGCDEMPIVGPRGLLTPFWDGWSLDSWVLTPQEELIPSRLLEANQELLIDENLRVVTNATVKGLTWSSEAETVLTDGNIVCRLTVRAKADIEGQLAISLRPYNPEGVSFVHDISHSPDGKEWIVNGGQRFSLMESPDRYLVSDYSHGDVYRLISDPSAVSSSKNHRCDVGMATAALLFTLTPGIERTVEVNVPLISLAKAGGPSAIRPWEETLAGSCRLDGAPPQLQFLFDTAVRVLIHLTPNTVYPGPYTYKRFWFRDASFILKSLLILGFDQRVERIIDGYPKLQDRHGYFISQEGEWDSNGEVLWIYDEYRRFTGKPPKDSWFEAICSGANWIIEKRLSDQLEKPHAGLLPAGFSAEHLGPNDYYYWDDFWGVAGLQRAAALAAASGSPSLASRFSDEAEKFLTAVHRSIGLANKKNNAAGIPASPYRRLDSGAIGSIAASYPLQLFEPRDPQLLATADFLVERCYVDGAFFQDMIHSGINAYLTLHVAQVLLRAGDRRYEAMVSRVAALASPTGQWPEAIHPLTLGGCMGDGEHSWASAEWVMMIRNCFVREEGPNTLIIGSSILTEWVSEGQTLSFGPAQTAFGPVTVRVTKEGSALVLDWDAHWRTPPSALVVMMLDQMQLVGDVGGISTWRFETA